ncbi:MAG: prepilin-type N-terminal cleavage/methylation domain-containing protein [Bacteroidota bacterium]|nr:prepilin-type N-terminal cleavage/methylation domain-containing protein [Bacteroidota bacterium]
MENGPKNKIKAFTLSEMLVVLLLTVIVVGLAFAVLNLVQKQMRGIQGVYEQKTENNQLKQALWIDFNSHSQIQWMAKNGELKFDDELKQTTYTFNEGYILKDRDTFYTDLVVKELYFNGNLVRAGKVDAMNLGVSDGSNDRELFVFKRNSASNFMD